MKCDLIQAIYHILSQTLRNSHRKPLEIVLRAINHSLLYISQCSFPGQADLSQPAVLLPAFLFKW